MKYPQRTFNELHVSACKASDNDHPTFTHSTLLSGESEERNFRPSIDQDVEILKLISIITKQAKLTSTKANLQVEKLKATSNVPMPPPERFSRKFPTK